MAEIRSLFEVTPKELASKPALRRFFPMREQVVRFGWFNWFWLGRCEQSNHTLLVGPFRTKRGAQRAWAKVPTKEDWMGSFKQSEADKSPHERALTSTFSDHLNGQ